MYNTFHNSRTYNFLYELTIKTVKLRNEGSYLGFLWYLLEPLIQFIILLIVFQDRLGANIPSYPLYLLIGIIHWELLGIGVQRCANALRQQSQLIKTLTIRLELFVLVAVIVTCILYCFNMCIYLGLFMPLKAKIGALWLYPIILFSELLLVAGIGLSLSAISIFFRDIVNAWMVLQRAWWFLTPVFYGRQFVVGWHETVSLYNPMFHILTNMRAILIYGATPSLMSVGYTLLGSGAIFIVGYGLFRKFAPFCAELM